MGGIHPIVALEALNVTKSTGACIRKSRSPQGDSCGTLKISLGQGSRSLLGAGDLLKLISLRDCHAVNARTGYLGRRPVLGWSNRNSLGEYHTPVKCEGAQHARKNHPKLGFQYGKADDFLVRILRKTRSGRQSIWSLDTKRFNLCASPIDQWH